jgi:hypothetical protein
VQFLDRALRLDANYAPAHAALADHFEQLGEDVRGAFHRASAGQKRVPRVRHAACPTVGNGILIPPPYPHRG